MNTSNEHQIDSMGIEEHKKMMKQDAVPLLENDASNAVFKFSEEHQNDGVMITMVVEQDGEEKFRTSEKVMVLNG